MFSFYYTFTGNIFYPMLTICLQVKINLINSISEMGKIKYT